MPPRAACSSAVDANGVDVQPRSEPAGQAGVGGPVQQGRVVLHHHVGAELLALQEAQRHLGLRLPSSPATWPATSESPGVRPSKSWYRARTKRSCGVPLLISVWAWAKNSALDRGGGVFLVQRASSACAASPSDEDKT